MDLHTTLRPREKLSRLGPNALKNEELLAILLRTGTRGKSVLELAQELLHKYSSHNLLETSLETLESHVGMGRTKAAGLIAAFELTKRLLGTENFVLPLIDSPQSVLAQVQDIRNLRKEHFVVLYLNARSQLIHKECISIGTLNASLVHPREVFAPALQHSAASLLLTHNHPSGDCTPSPEDITVTKQLKNVGTILDIEVLDHIVVSSHQYFSFREKYPWETLR